MTYELKALGPIKSIEGLVGTTRVPIGSQGGSLA